MPASLYRTVFSFRKGIIGKRSSDLMCFAVCAPLQGYLGMLGYETKLVKGEIDVSADYVIGHYWLALPDGRIIDPTADQFESPTGEKMPEVYIGERPEWYRVT
jgi:hypothetical protein